MGRLIDVSELHNIITLNKSDWGIFSTSIDQLIESLVSQAPTVEAIVIPNNSTNGDVTMVVYSEPIANLIKFHMGDVWWKHPYKGGRKW